MFHRIIPFFSNGRLAVKRFVGTLALLSFGIVSYSSFAENLMANAINLEEAIKKSIAQHPDLKLYQYQLNAQRGLMKQSAVSSPSEISFSLEEALGTGELEGLTSAESGVSISWVLDKNIINKKVNVQSSKKEIIEIEQQIKKIDVAAKTALYFFNTLSFQEKLEVATLSVEQITKTIKQIEKRVNAGKSSSSDLLRAQVELEKALLYQEDILHEIKSSTRMLVAQWGEKRPYFKTLKGSLQSPPKFMELHELEQQLSKNPSLKRFMTLKGIAQAKIELAQENPSSVWRVATGIKHHNRSGDFGLTAGLSIPIGQANRNQGLIAALTAEQNQHQAEFEALKKNVEARLFVLFEQLKHAQHVREALHIKIIPSLNKALAETNRVYLQGKYSYMELTSVQRDLLKAKNELIEANLLMYLTMIEIEQLTGAQLTRLEERKES